MMDRMAQRSAFASKVGNEQFQQAMSQYQDWTKNNPQAVPRQRQAGSDQGPSFKGDTYHYPQASGDQGPSFKGDTYHYPQASGDQGYGYPQSSSSGFDMAAYAPSPALSGAKPAQAGGSNTAYTQAWNAYAPQVNQTQQFRTMDPVRQIPRSTETSYRTTAAKSYGGEGAGNLAYMPNDKRPAGFEAKYEDFDGNLSSTPSTNYRDALIERINAAAKPYYANSGVTDNSMGPQQFDMPTLMREANGMAQNGYVNPLLQGLYQR